jgi:hypothetical protein
MGKGINFVNGFYFAQYNLPFVIGALVLIIGLIVVAAGGASWHMPMWLVWTVRGLLPVVVLGSGYKIFGPNKYE